MKNTKAHLSFLVILILLIDFLHYVQAGYSEEKIPPAYTEALKLMGAQNYDQAINCLTQLITDRPQFIRAYAKIVEAYKWNNDLNRGVAYFQSIIKDNPHNSCLYYARGLISLERKDFRNAIRQFQHAIQLAPNYPEVYYSLVQAYFDLQKLNDAETFLFDLLQKNPTNYAICFGLGFLKIKSQQWNDAIGYLDNALKLQPNLPDVYLKKGAIYWYTSRFQELLEISQAGLILSEKQSDLEYQCRLTGNVGLAYMYLTNYPQALKCYENALSMAQQIGEKREQVRNLGNIGAIYMNTGDYKKTLAYYGQAVEKAEQIGDQKQASLFYRNIGTTYRFLGDCSRALEYYNKALPIVKEIRDQNTEALLLWDIGLVNWDYGNYWKAIDYYQQALKIAREMENRWGQGRFICAIGIAYLNLGNFQLALENLQQASAISEEIKDYEGQAIAIGNIAIAYLDFFDYSSAEKHYFQAIELSHKFGNINEESRHVGNLAILYLQLKEYDKALTYFKQVIKLFKEVGNKKDEAIFLGNLGYLYRELNDFSKANVHFKHALTIAREIGDKREETNQLINLGALYLKLKHHDISLQYFLKALKSVDILMDPRLVWEVHTGIAEVYHQQRKLQHAYDHYKTAINEIEKIRNFIPTEEFKKGFLDNYIVVYEKLIRLLAELNQLHPGQGYDQQSFEYAERAKARVLLDILYKGRAFHNVTDIPEDFKEKFLLINNKIEQKHAALSTELARAENKQNNKSILSLKSEIESLERAESKLEEDLKQQNPRYYQLTNPRILSIRDIQHEILDSNKVLLEYFIGAEESYLWIITKEQSAMIPIPLTRSELTERLTAVSPLFNRERIPENYQIDHRGANIQPDLLNQLYHVLIEKPAAKYIDHGNELIIIPDDVLHYFPFEILVTNLLKQQVEYFIEQHPISYAASASLLNPELKGRQYAVHDLLACGNPYFGGEKQNVVGQWMDYLATLRPIFRNDQFIQLPHAEKEVKGIARHFPNPTLLIGKEATEYNFKTMAGKYQFIHLATHNITNDKQPMYSKIVFARDERHNEDGYLQTYEIYNLNIKARMVILSGCNTGIGQFSRGEGLIGMTRAFLYAGTPSVVVSLWPVNDESTALLMNNFYRYLKAGDDKARALQKAKIDLIRSADWKKNPFYWGPFILVGDWHPVEMN